MQVYNSQVWSLSVSVSGWSSRVWNLSPSHTFLTWPVCRWHLVHAPAALGRTSSGPSWSGLKQILIWGVLLGTLPFLFPPAYATGPLVGGIFSGTHTPSKVLLWIHTCHMRRISLFIARFSQYILGWVWMPFSDHLFPTPVGGNHDVYLVSCCS